jgi:hypothetical protein
MKVLVVGSATGLDPEGADKLMVACRSLGDCLARNKHTIIACSSDDGTADKWVVEGADEADGPHEVILFRDENRPVPFDGREEPFKNLRFKHRAGHGPRAVGRIHAIKESNALVVLGGSDGTVQIGLSAFAMGWPVLAIPSFGGGAKEVWRILSPYYPQAGISQSELGELDSIWDADLTIRCLNKLAKRNPFKSSEFRSRLILLAFVLSLIGSWFGLFNNQYAERWGRNVAVCLLLLVSAFAGTVLRFALTLQPEDAIVRMLTQLLTELAVGVALAFGFSLLYLAGAFVITGKFVVLETDPDFSRVAAAMSMLAFGAGFAIEFAAPILRERVVAMLSRGRHS